MNVFLYGIIKQFIIWVVGSKQLRKIGYSAFIGFLLCLGDFTLAATTKKSPTTIITDHRGYNYDVQKKPKRIASMAVSSDVILFELLQKEPQKRIVALSPYSRIKRFSPIYNKVQGIPNELGEELEGIIALKPDLVIAASYTRAELIKALRAANLTIFVLGGFRTLDDIRRNIITIGKLTHTSKKAAAIIADFDRRLAKIKHKNPGKKTIRVLNYSVNYTLWGKNTLFDAATQAAKVINIAAQMGFIGWPQVGLEVLSTLKPDLVIAAGEAEDQANTIAAIQKRPGWRTLAAVKEGRILIIPERILTTASHYLINLVEIIHKRAYE